jgi:hypothetical protein
MLDRGDQIALYWNAHHDQILLVDLGMKLEENALVVVIVISAQDYASVLVDFMALLAICKLCCFDFDILCTIQLARSTHHTINIDT